MKELCITTYTDKGTALLNLHTLSNLLANSKLKPVLMCNNTVIDEEEKETGTWSIHIVIGVDYKDDFEGNDPYDILLQAIRDMLT
jgi:hypothetical protein